MADVRACKSIGRRPGAKARHVRLDLGAEIVKAANSPYYQITWRPWRSCTQQSEHRQHRHLSRLLGDLAVFGDSYEREGHAFLQNSGRILGGGEELVCGGHEAKVNHGGHGGHRGDSFHSPGIYDY